MKLAQPFIRLPLRYDAARLADEVRALPASAWARHPNSFEGNSALRLISADGGENDDVDGHMQQTVHLQNSPYIQQVLASFGVVWSRSRLMKLAPGAQVPPHSDMNYHWFKRVRIHIPILTRPGVAFYCDDQVVHMAAGDAWVFDNWRQHRVENATSEERVHLVADTSGSAAFWNLVSAGLGGRAAQLVEYRAGQPISLALERFNVFRVMPPSEIEMLIGDLLSDLSLAPDGAGTPTDLALFQSLMRSFCADWRQMWALHGDTDNGIEQFRKLLQAMWARVKLIAQTIVMRSNGLPVLRVLDARVVSYAVNERRSKSLATAELPRASVSTAPAFARLPRFERPVFVIAAPRSGSTLLYETLACSPQLWTVGGEAHWLVEGFDHLSPGAPGIDDNRVDSRWATPPVHAEILRRLAEHVHDPSGVPLPVNASALRLLEKTPKNSLRIPFFDKIFPDALFVFLWRDPHENISSIIEAWKSGRWETYRKLPDWDGPWSLLLPPGWRALRGRPLAEIAAFQWEATNRIVLDDLQALPASRWLSVRYAELIADPSRTVQRVCDFAGLSFDAALRQRVGGAQLPMSKYTLTAPEPEKWRRNAGEIESVIASIQATWLRLRAL